jgi:hypothetical protein
VKGAGKLTVSMKFKVNTFNGVHDFTLFKILKDVLTLTSYTLLDTPTSNLDLSFKMDTNHTINFIK